MERAKILILGDDDKTVEDDTIEVMFNPTEYQTAVNVNWAACCEGARPEFKGSNFDNFTLALFFDTYEKCMGEAVDVREDHYDAERKKTVKGTNRLVELTVPTVKGVKTRKPPVCVFSWGKFNFKCVIERVEQNFTMFWSDGTPVRAKVTVTMKPILTAKDMLQSKGVGACRRARIIKAGERLDIIAAEELKSPLLWTKIAKANNIADPLNFPGPADIGRVLIIPD